MELGRLYSKNGGISRQGATYSARDIHPADPACHWASVDEFRSEAFWSGVEALVAPLRLLERVVHVAQP